MPHPHTDRPEDIEARLRRIGAFMVEMDFGNLAALFAEAAYEIQRLRLQIPAPESSVPSPATRAPENCAANNPGDIGLRGPGFTSVRHDYFQRRISEMRIDQPGSDYDGLIGKWVLELSMLFSKQGHSGQSAALTSHVFNELMKEWEDPACHHSKTP